MIFLGLPTVYAQDLSGRITYNVSLNLTVELASERNEKIGRKISQRSIDRINNAKDILAFLEFDKQHAIHKLDSKLKNDGIRSMNITRTVAGNKKKYYTNNSLVQKNSEIECSVFEKCFLIKQPKPVWEISQETKIIGGYLCYRAVYQNPLSNGKKPIAWFAPKIPARYGPKIYTGLPGLILELEDSSVTFTAIKIEINPKEKIIITKPEGETISKANYEKLLRKTFPSFYKNFEKYKSSGKSH